MITVALRSMLPPGVGIAARSIADGQPPLWPGEEVAVRHAIPARRQEFAAGRAVARAAMQDAGLEPAALPAGPDRAPRWPTGVAGSISHAAGVAAGLAGRSAVWAGIGLDIEKAAPLDADLAAIIRASGDCDGSELGADLSATLAFSAKEAAFKAQFPLTGLWLDHREVGVTLTPTSFTVVVRDVPLIGRWMRADGMFLSILLAGPEQARQLGSLDVDVVAR
ncbi:MAG: phosphopantetheinyl transferase [Pseudomonadota bacterium]|nr:phosphopantetheinyl transferase [Pseudomonadota bacterium]